MIMVKYCRMPRRQGLHLTCHVNADKAYPREDHPPGNLACLIGVRLGGSDGVSEDEKPI